MDMTDGDVLRGAACCRRTYTINESLKELIGMGFTGSKFHCGQGEHESSLMHVSK